MLAHLYVAMDTLQTQLTASTAITPNVYLLQCVVITTHQKLIWENIVTTYSVATTIKEVLPTTFVVTLQQRMMLQVL
jgi:hypothetical protein